MVSSPAALIFKRWLDFKKMKTQITMRYHFTPPMMAATKITIIIVGQDVEKLEPLYITCRNVKWSSHWGTSMVVPQKAKPRIAIWPSDHTSRYIPERNEKRDLSRQYTHVHYSTIHNSQKVKRTNNMAIYFSCSAIQFSDYAIILA